MVDYFLKLMGLLWLLSSTSLSTLNFLERSWVWSYKEWLTWSSLYYRKWEWATSRTSRWWWHFVDDFLSDNIKEAIVRRINLHEKRPKINRYCSGYVRKLLVRICIEYHYTKWLAYKRENTIKIKTWWDSRRNLPSIIPLLYKLWYVCV